MPWAGPWGTAEDRQVGAPMSPRVPLWRVLRTTHEQAGALGGKGQAQKAWQKRKQERRGAATPSPGRLGSERWTIGSVGESNPNPSALLVGTKSRVAAAGPVWQ